jgi:2-haloacid dehalogenase
MALIRMTSSTSDTTPHSPLAPLTNIQACAFDAYGTLFDLDTTVGRTRDRIGDKTAALTRAWRARQMALAKQPVVGESDYWHVTGAALDAAMAELGLADPHLRARLMQLMLNADTFPDALPALRYLKQAGMRTAILSNGTTTMLLSATKHTALYKFLDAVISTESTHVYKPDPAAYALVAERLHLPASAICYVTGNAWDAEAAAQAGLRAVWVERGGEPARIALKLGGLDELPALLGR